MPISPTNPGFGNFVYVKPGKTGAGVTAVPAAVEPGNRQDLLTARGQLLRLFVAIQAVAEALNVSTKLRLDLPDAQSTQGLGLDLSSTAAFLQSLGEINASPHSFSPFGPNWSGASSALLTIGGEYDGSHGSGNLSFQVVRPGTHGADNLRIRVRDPSGSVISNTNVRANDDPDMQYSLQNGLYFTLGTGGLIDNDTSAIQLFQNVGSQFDPAQPLGGVRNQNPNFQYYPAPGTLPAIVDGSFTINGQSISVSAAESMNAVIARINQSAAGVTATYNAATERVDLLQNTLGSAASIVLQNDSSNFLQSAKLDTAPLTPGIDPESQRTLSSVAAFSTVQSGSILINGTSIAIDANSDTLESVIAKINASPAVVNAAFDTQTQRVLIQANDPSSILEIDSNGTGLFAALQMPEGRVDPEADGRGVSRRRSYDIADAVESMMAEMNVLFRDSAFQNGSTFAKSFRSRINSAVSQLFAAGSDGNSNIFGLLFDRSDSAMSNGRFASLERRDFTHSLQRRGEDVRILLAGDGDDAGIIGRLAAAAGTAIRDIDNQLGLSATLLDTFA